MTDTGDYGSMVVDYAERITNRTEGTFEFPSSFIGFTGSVDGALLLSKIIQYQEYSGRYGGWFFKTYADWESEVGLSKYKVGKIVARMKNRGYLKTRVKKAKDNPTVHYFLDHDEFERQLVDYLEKRSVPENETNEGSDHG